MNKRTATVALVLSGLALSCCSNIDDVQTSATGGTSGAANSAGKANVSGDASTAGNADTTDSAGQHAGGQVSAGGTTNVSAAGAAGDVTGPTTGGVDGAGGAGGASTEPAAGGAPPAGSVKAACTDNAQCDSGLCACSNKTCTLRNCKTAGSFCVCRYSPPDQASCSQSSPPIDNGLKDPGGTGCKGSHACSGTGACI